MNRRETESVDVWASFADLMSGVMLVVLLLLLVFIVQTADAQEQAKEAIERAEQEASEKRDLQDFVERSVGVEAELIAALRVHVETVTQGRSGIEVTDDGFIRIVDSPEAGRTQGVTFGHDKYVLTPAGKQLLDWVAKALELTLAEPRFQRVVSRVTVEGHTSSVGREEHNWWLSTQRALAVGRYLRSSRPESALNNLLLVGGRAALEPVMQPGTDDSKPVENEAASRRIEFKLVLSDQETLKEVRDRLRELEL
jgi:outer membrane protein OmpA-like peptidoglycan-associated protein